MESSTRIINVRTQRSGHLYGGRYHWCLITNPTYYAHALKYVYRNPVKAGLSESAEGYPYSTLRAVLGIDGPSIALANPLNSFSSDLATDLWEFKNWIESPYASEESEAIRIALRRKEFKLPLRQSNRKRLSIATRL